MSGKDKPLTFGGRRVGTYRAERDEAGVTFTARVDGEIADHVAQAAHAPRPAMSFRFRQEACSCCAAHAWSAAVEGAPCRWCGHSPESHEL